MSGCRCTHPRPGSSCSPSDLRRSANQRIVFDEDIDPDAAIALLDAATFEDVAEAARTVDPDKLAVACVGPHESGEFSSG